MDQIAVVVIGVTIVLTIVICTALILKRFGPGNVKKKVVETFSRDGYLRCSTGHQSDEEEII